MQRRGGIVLAAALLMFGGACGSGDGEPEAFELTGRVVSVEPAAQPADDPTDAEISGAIVVQTDEPEECESDADGVRVYVSDDTSLTPASASDDLQSLQGKTVSVSGETTRDGDACTAVADTITTAGATGSPDATDDGDGTGTGGATPGGSTADPSATDDGGPTSSPNDPDDEGGIGDTEETASPAPDDPDDEGVIDNSGSGSDNSGKGGGDD
jgi:hypothetical protein